MACIEFRYGQTIAKQRQATVRLTGESFMLYFRVAGRGFRRNNILTKANLVSEHV